MMPSTLTLTSLRVVFRARPGGGRGGESGGDRGGKCGGDENRGVCVMDTRPFSSPGRIWEGPQLFLKIESATEPSCVCERGSNYSGFWTSFVWATTVNLTVKLSSGKIPWLDIHWEIRRCDWLGNSCFCMGSSLCYQALGDFPGQ